MGMARNAFVVGAAAGLIALAGKEHVIPVHLLDASGTPAACHKLERLWLDAGGSPARAQMAASIAMAESGGDRYSTDNNTNGTVDRGYWQINSVHGALSTYDPAANARAAVAISGDGSNWTPWVTYNTGAYAGRC
ncbi:MAG TPA: hypothetical protein VGG25_08210 [Streptosporangiaceae bacterium]|jgi:hypothetical protein